MASQNNNLPFKHLNTFFNDNHTTYTDIYNYLEAIITKEEEFDSIQWLLQIKNTMHSFAYHIIQIILLRVFCDKIGTMPIGESLEYYFFENCNFGKKIYIEKIKEAITKAPINTKTKAYFTSDKIEEKNSALIALLRELEIWRGNIFPNKKTKEKIEKKGVNSGNDNNNNNNNNKNKVNDDDMKYKFCKRLFLSMILIKETKVELTGAFIKEENSDFLFDSLSCNPKITELILRENMFGVMGMKYLSVSLCLNNSFTKLDLSRNCINASMLNTFRLGLNGNLISNIKYLYLSNNLINGNEEGGGGGKAIGQLLEHFPNLKHLNLNKNKLEKGGVYLFQMMIKLVKSNKLKLKKLIISKTFLDAHSLKCLSELILHPNCQLKLLSLNDNNLNNFGGFALLHSLKYTNTIRELYMYNCSLNDNHFDLIKELIISNRIDWINLYKNVIVNPKHFLELLSYTQIIKGKTILTHNDSELEGQSQIKDEADYELQILQYLDISENQLTEFNKEDFQILSSIIKNTGLERLDIIHSIDFFNENIKEEAEQFYNEYTQTISNRKLVIYF